MSNKVNKSEQYRQDLIEMLNQLQCEWTIRDMILKAADRFAQQVALDKSESDIPKHNDSIKS